MEVKKSRHIQRHSIGLLVLLLVFPLLLSAQLQKAYTVKKGRMFIQLPKGIPPASLDSFVHQFNLVDLDLSSFLKTSNPDSLQKLGWTVDINNETGIIISKALLPFDGLKHLDDKMMLNDHPDPVFPVVSSAVVYGVNRFRNKTPFTVSDSVVRFFLRQHLAARQVFLAGSFNNWQPADLRMQKTDSGWIYDIKLRPGKWWYKFIVNGAWIIDKDNLHAENDGQGNINSVFFQPNTFFRLNGFGGAKKVYLAGSFNGWKPNALPMQKTAAGWALPLYLADGTHTYKFVVDGQWHADPGNEAAVADGEGGRNSVLRLGKPHRFQLKGFADAKQVMLMGSFNGWRDFEWPMKKTADGWETEYTLGDGNHAYQFVADGKRTADPANPLRSASSGHSYLILNPNYQFRLKGFSEAKKVYLAGGFNNWDPEGYAMQRDGQDWVFTVHLSPGKHLYKFVVDGKWITDPANKWWEQNEYGTGNSVLWLER